MKALVIIDVQETYVGRRREEAEFQKVMATINAAAAAFREHRLPVFVVRDLSEGSDSRFDNVRELIVEPTDVEILKMYNNSFWKTKLEELLQAQKADWLLLCGSAVEFCVTATYFGAVERGFTTHILIDGALAVTAEGLSTMERFRPTLTLNDLQAQLGSTAP